MKKRVWLLFKLMPLLVLFTFACWSMTNPGASAAPLEKVAAKKEAKAQEQPKSNVKEGDKKEVGQAAAAPKEKLNKLEKQSNNAVGKKETLADKHESRALVNDKNITVTEQNIAELENIKELIEEEQGSEEFLVKFRPGTPSETKRSFNSANKVKEKDLIPGINVSVLATQQGISADEVIKLYQKNPNVVFAEPNHIAQVEQVPNDLWFSNWQKGLQRMDAVSAWDITTGSKDIIIAVLDTGVMAAHEDLIGRLTGGYDFVNGNNNPNDDHGHGTKVAGIIGASTNNEKGVAGTTWQNPVMPVKVMGADGTGTYSNIAKGIIYAADNGARVINMSLGGSSASSTLKSAVDYAYSRNAVLVAAAGNSNGPVLYPAAYTNVIAVAAVDNYDKKASYSCYGPEISVSAPGNGVFSTIRTGDYDMGSGTSFAAPFVAGLAGLILSVEPSLSPGKVQEFIEKGADDLGEPGWDQYTGWGRINMARSLALLPQKTADIVPPNVKILSPEDGISTDNHVTIVVEATDNVAVKEVQFYIDELKVATTNNAPYTYVWQTADLSDGKYTIRAEAIDTSFNRSASEPVYVIKNTESVTEPDEPEATPIPEQPTTVEFMGVVGDRKLGSTAVHNVTVSGSGNIDARLTWGTRRTNLDLYLYDPTGVLVASSRNSTLNNLQEQLATFVMSPGIYSLRVVSVSGKTNYSLTVTHP